MTPPPPLADPTAWIDARERAAEAAQGVGLFSFMRHLERAAGSKPRIGRNERLRDALLRMGQDPALAFPGRDLARVDALSSVPKLRAQFMGFFGPFGAFPLNWTEETLRWFESGDEAFVAFVDIFVERFQELFFRSWSDARAITQFDHPTDDRFQAWLLSFIGQGTPAFRGRDSLPDTVRLRTLSLTLAEVKSPVRLRQMLEVQLGDGVTVEVEEFAPTWLDFEEEMHCRLGQRGARLGRDCHLGRRTRSISDKIVLHVTVSTLAQFDALLPGGAGNRVLSDLVHGYLGQRFEIDVSLRLPRGEICPAVLGQSARLGWMACVAPEAGPPETRVLVSRFALLRASQAPANTPAPPGTRAPLPLSHEKVPA